MTTLQVKLISAQLSRDTEMFSNMDPYCFLILGKQKLRSRTKDEAGKKPVWNETFRFTSTDTNLKIVVMDEDTFSDDKVGEGTIDVSRFRNAPTSREVVQLYYGGKSAGKVILEIGSGQQGGQQQWGQQGNNWQSQQPNRNTQQQWGQQSYQQPQQYPPQQQQQWGHQSYQQPQQGGMGHKWGPQPPNQGWGGNQSNPNSQWGDLSKNNGWGDFAPSNPNPYPSNPNQPQPNPMALLGNMFNGNMPPPQPNNNNNGYGNNNGGYNGGSGGGNPYQANPYR